ncbi:MAG: efflux RND transporter periplasmic adaptor subunit [Bryobacteraceae bacterium]
MKKALLLVALLAAAGIPTAWLWKRQGEPPEVPFARARRERLVSTLVTNGKVEPEDWIAIRAVREGSLEKLYVERGRRVRAGDPIADLDLPGLRAELTAAQARFAEARAELEILNRGGAAGELAAIESGIAEARLTIDVTRREIAALSRLVEKKAAAAAELTPLRDRIKQEEARIAALEKKRAALVSPGNRAAVEARLREANAAVDLARQRVEQSTLRSPMDGVVYHLELRPGAWVRAGDLVAEVGRLERMRVTVYVDEPELGRVETGMPVTITWDAMQGRRWEGTVSRMPTRIVALGTRQVGEVICRIVNEGLDLPPGANINAEVRSRIVEDGLTVPKEAVRRDNAGASVLVLEGDRVVRHAVQIGTTNVTHAEILGGIAEGALVALPVDPPLADGARVKVRRSERPPQR